MNECERDDSVAVYFCMGFLSGCIVTVFWVMLFGW